jgi:type IV pilus assembly protein PilC
MTNYAYEAVDMAGLKIAGTLEVTSQNEALQRIKDMGLFPTRVVARGRARIARGLARPHPFARLKTLLLTHPLFAGRVKPAAVCVFTRQLATLVDAGLPLLRGLRILAQQESNRTLQRIIAEVGEAIESGSSLSEALSVYPKVFNRLYVNMVKAGEASGALEVSLRRLAEFMEKAQKIKGKVKSAMFYPVSVMFVATAILIVMMIYVVPRFQGVFAGLLGGQPMPVFTQFVLNLSDLARHHAPLVALGGFAVFVAFAVGLRTVWGRWVFDRFKLNMPVLGKVLRAAAISRFARTLGTLLGNGVPILQALTILREAAGNVQIASLISTVHDCVKEGDTITIPLRESGMFPPMVVGMVDVGEQTGALPDMLMKVADDCDDQVDNAVSAMTSLLEPIMIVFLAVVVGGIVIAMFLPIIGIIDKGFDGPNSSGADN